MTFYSYPSLLIYEILKITELFLWFCSIAWVNFIKNLNAKLLKYFFEYQ